MPRAGLDTEAVVAAAAGLADDVGLERLTLAGLAAALGIRTPSLYAHVNGLPDLRARMGARGARELAIQLPASPLRAARAPTPCARWRACTAPTPTPIPAATPPCRRPPSARRTRRPAPRWWGSSWRC